MNYELAKELKDAGLVWDSDNADYPTLSELIEACGIYFGALERAVSEKEITWLCGGLNHAFIAKGDTPEEAVARLWLALYDATGK